MLLGLVVAHGAPASSFAKSKNRDRGASGRPAAATLADGEQVLEAPVMSTASAITRDPEILSIPEMLSLAKQYAATIADLLVVGERHRETAVRAKDAIKLSCIQDRLSNMKLMKMLSESRLAATERPEIRADELNLRHEFRGIELAHERVTQLSEELVQCAGETLEISVASQAGASAGASAAASDPTSMSVEAPKIDRPVPASAYQ